SQIWKVVDLDSPLANAAIVRDSRNPNQAVGIAKRQRAQQQGIDHAEDGGAGTDAESDDQDREGCEPGVAAQGSDGVAQILKQGFEERQAAYFAMLLFDGFKAAQPHA